MIFRFGAYELDEPAGELRHRGDAVPVQPKPLALLGLLLRERHRVVPLDELFERLWPDTVVTPGSLTRAVSLARRAIGDTHRGSIIRSFSRRGYRFCGEVVEVGAPAPTGRAAAAAPTPVPAPRPPPAVAASPLPCHSPDAEPFVGRGDALAALEAELEDALTGRGGLALVTGPAGIGKTRVVETFAAQVALRGPTVVFGRAREGEGVPAFWLWAQVLRRLLADEAFRDPLMELGEVGGELVGLVPELGAPAEAAPGGSAEQRRFLFFDAITRALGRCGRARPLVVVLEDIQWAGEASLRLLEHLAFELRDARVLLVVTVRDEPRERTHPLERVLALLRRQSHGREVPLRSFSRGEVGDLLERAIGQRPPADLTSELYARTEGVPLFIREAVRLLGERGDLRHPERIARQGLVLPAKTFDLIRRALDALEPATTELLETASVIGREFPLALLAALADCGREEALDRIDEAEQAGVLEPSPDAPATWRFAHALYQEAAYEGLSTARRARLHHRTAEILARQHEGHTDAVVAELAFHRHQGLAVGDPELAFESALRAAGKAQRLLAYEQAAAHLEQAAAALEHFPSVDPDRHLETLLALGHAHRTSGERSRRREVFARALEMARTLGRPEALARAAIGFCDISEWSTRDDAAESALSEALERLDGAAGPARARMLTRLAYLAVLGDAERARETAREAVTLARKEGDPEALQEALYTLHFAIAGPDHLDERGALVDELLEVARKADCLDTTVIALIDVASDRIELGDAEGAQRLRREADRVAGARPHPGMVWHVRLYDAGCALMTGGFDEALALTEEALLLGRRIGHPYARGCYEAHQVGVARERGDHETVVRLFERGIHAERGATHYVRAVLGRALHALGREDEARMHFEVLASRDFDAVPRNIRFVDTMVETAHLCAELGDDARARRLADLLEPVEHHHGVLAVPVCYGGPVSFARARLLARLGLRDEAVGLLEEASLACAALEARPMQARIGVELGALRARSGDRRRAREDLQAALRLAGELGQTGVESEARSRLESLGGA